MNSFLVGLQFLTRIHISNETVWKDEEFGKSVIWFPVYGWIIGAFMCLIYFLLKPLDMPYLTAFLIVLGELFISGGTLADGLMDSSDGLFSGRSRERCLEIMKDSLIGSFGMLSIIIFINLFTLSLGSIDGLLYPILIAAPALGRLNLVISICPSLWHGQSLFRLSSKACSSHCFCICTAAGSLFRISLCDTGRRSPSAGAVSESLDRG